MEVKRHYDRCGIIGEGEFIDKLFPKKSGFKIVDISASGVKIITKIELKLSDIIKLKLRFSGNIFEVEINVSAKVLREGKVDFLNEYSLEFIDLSNNDIVEIDEIVRRSCDISSIEAVHCEKDQCMYK